MTKRKPSLFISYISALIIAILSFGLIFFILIDTSEKMMELDSLTYAYSNAIQEHHAHGVGLKELFLSPLHSDFFASISDMKNPNGEWFLLMEKIKRLPANVDPALRENEEREVLRDLFIVHEQIQQKIQSQLRVFKFLFFFFLLIILILVAAVIVSIRERLKQDVHQDLEEHHRLHIIMQLEKERNLVSYHLHDDIAQSMVFLKSYLESENPDYIRSKKQRAADLAVEVLSSVRNLSQSLRAPTLKEGGFEGVMKGLCEDINRNCALSIRHSFIGTSGLKPQSESFLHIYRITQELLNNGCRHSKGSRIDMKFLYSYPYLILNYSDDGIGLDSHWNEVAKGRMGLKGIEYRCKFLKGELTFPSGERKGTLIRIRIPLEDENETPIIG